MRSLDLIVLTVYLLGLLLFGAYFSRSQRNVRDYFVTGRQIPWWAIMGSIVATETSTVSLISVPGFAYGADLSFLHLVIGYLFGRLAIALFLMPTYFKGEVLTVYQILGFRFGENVRRLTSALFLLTRSLADGFRLFATGLVLAALLLTSSGTTLFVERVLPGLESNTGLLVLSLLVIAVVTVVYTFLGGMAAVIWTDVIQLTIYLFGAGLIAIILLDLIPGGWTEVTRAATDAGKFNILDFTFSLSKDYTFWSGVIGGAFLTTATHGTDQLMVQRYLCSRTSRDATKALIVSGIVVFLQFILFLVIGVMLWVYYTNYAQGDLSVFSLEGQIQTDRILPHFMVTHLPVGLLGLLLAAIFAAGMSTLSSSLNSSSAALMADFYMPYTRYARSEEHYLRVSRWTTVGWGLIQLCVAILAIQLSTRVVDEVLGIASFTNGVLLGTFLLAIFTTRVGSRSVLTGIVVGILFMTTLRASTALNIIMVSWQWYVLIGSVVTVGTAWLTHLVADNTRELRRDLR